jgi:hypothetical protein
MKNSESSFSPLFLNYISKPKEDTQKQIPTEKEVQYSFEISAGKVIGKQKI